MKQKNLKIKGIIVLLIIIALIFLPVISFADFGDFETYDSGSSWSSSSSSDYGSSWSSGSYSSSSWDDDDYYSYGGTGSIGSIEELIVIVVIVVIVVVVNSKSKNNAPMPVYQPRTVATTSNEAIEAKVRQTDELFSSEEFISWAKDVFVKLQVAWMEKDWNIIRHFETVQMFEQTRQQMQSYIDNHKTNKLERICVKTANFEDFKQSGDKDVLTVIISSKMIDYIVNDDTNEIIKGDDKTDRHSTYKMTFVRKTGVKTKEGMSTVNTTNCPNCGAPTEITSTGQCEYCGSVITTGDFSWVLSSIEKLY